jgi:hypothetical protein
MPTDDEGPAGSGQGDVAEAWAAQRRRSGRRGQLRRSLSRVRGDRANLRHLPTAVVGALLHPAVVPPPVAEVAPGPRGWCVART